MAKNKPKVQIEKSNFSAKIVHFWAIAENSYIFIIAGMEPKVKDSVFLNLWPLKTVVLVWLLHFYCTHPQKGALTISSTFNLLRIGNLLVPNNNYVKFEEWLMPILDKLLEEQNNKGVVWTPSKIIHRFPSVLHFCNILLTKLSQIRVRDQRWVVNILLGCKVGVVEA